MHFSILLLQSLSQVWQTLLHNWPFLAISALVAAAMKLYVKQEQVARFLHRHQSGGVLAATTAAVGTPLCSCGTTAVILGMMAGSIPWAPIIAFMVASPLTSPQELLYSAGLFGWPFALAFFGASIALGLLGGAAGAAADRRGWLRGQARLRADASGACGCPAPHDSALPPTARCTCDPQAARAGDRHTPARASIALLDRASLVPPPTLTLATSPCCTAGGTGLPAARGSLEPTAGRIPGQPTQGEARRGSGLLPFLGESCQAGGRLLLFFLAFAFVGYLINGAVPRAWITALFGGSRVYGVPLAATLGLPFYLNSEASLPLVRGLLDAGMSPGAALAFLITGAGSSIGAVAGALTIARWRVVGLVVGTLWLGAILCGLGYDALLAAGLALAGL